MANDRQKPVGLPGRKHASLISLGLAVCGSIALAGWWFGSGNNPPSITTTPESGMTCDMGISAAKVVRSAPSTIGQPVAANTESAQQAVREAHVRKMMAD